MTEMRTPSPEAYATLGVQPEDDFATIRRAWRKLVRAHHPDVSDADPDTATKTLTKLNEAYDMMRWHHPDKAPEVRRIEQAASRARREALQARRILANALRQAAARAAEARTASKAAAQASKTTRPAASAQVIATRPHSLTPAQRRFAAARKAMSNQQGRTLRCA
ncbi:MAG: J domain-containing protein [Pelagimonas sp.]|jgi:DnaJ-class molecular chaperone|nr:J domain-containing protein [Pelagimonas sp.]